MQALYQLDIQGRDALEMLDAFLRENEPDEFTRKLAADWTRHCWQDRPRCDELIVASTIKWQFSRLAPVDKSILRLAVYQLTSCPDIPPKVVINEAIELAKKFGTEKSGAFVNGVLDAIHRKLKCAVQGG